MMELDDSRPTVVVTRGRTCEDQPVTGRVTVHVEGTSIDVERVLRAMLNGGGFRRG